MKDLEESTTTTPKYPRRLIKCLKDAAAKAVADGDPWSKYDIPSIPAERIIRHLYHPISKQWSIDETIVKIEKNPFTHGAMRHCYRMKKRSPPPTSASNHRFHDYGWSRASNYVAKAYHKESDDNNNNSNGYGNSVIDTSDEAITSIKNDIMLQYEASHWAEIFNETDPPTKISFIRAYAIEFPDRPGKPWFAVERYISGTDAYGNGFVKHNTNAGFVDLELHRVTPQVFSAYTFYKSQGTRLVADIQGVGDLYTDPQVLSSDYRFGDGDLGPRGMALFFKTFRHSSISDACGIPIFQLSRNELKAQAKYEEEEQRSCDTSSIGSSYDCSSGTNEQYKDRFAQLDANRQRRANILTVVPGTIHDDGGGNDDQCCVPEEEQKTERRSNMRDHVRKSIRKSLTVPKNAHLALFRRTKSDIDEVQMCFELAKKDAEFDHHTYHRQASGELKNRHYCTTKNDSDAESNDNPRGNASDNHQTMQTIDDNNPNHESTSSLIPRRNKRSSMIVKHVAPIIPITEETKVNLGKVHFQLAVLHGMGRFPDVVKIAAAAKAKSEGTLSPPPIEDQPAHDVYSVLFHLAHAASFRNVSACLALARVQAGLETAVSELLQPAVSIDFESAKQLLRRAMEESSLPTGPTGPRAAAGCLLYQILQDEKATPAILIDESIENQDDSNDEGDDVFAENNAPNVHKIPTDHEMMAVIEDTIRLMEMADQESHDLKKHKERVERGGHLHVGDKVNANFAHEGTYYPGIVDAISDDGQSITVKYDDDGSCETFLIAEDHVKPLIPPTAHATEFGATTGLSDEEALGFENADETFVIAAYELKAELAELKARTDASNKAVAVKLYEEAAEGAMNDGKMKTASEWSLKAAALL